MRGAKIAMPLINFIAAYWWVWLIGVVVLLCLVLVRSVANAWGLLKDVATVGRQLRDVKRAPREERREKLTSLGVELGWKKIKSRIINHALTLAMSLLGAFFGLLLLIAFARHAYVYFNTA